MNPGTSFWILCSILALGGLVQATQALIARAKRRRQDTTP